jgi:hypothetical protein
VRVDRDVNLAKFEREVELLRSQRALLAGWGCHLVRAENLEIDILVVPTRRLMVGVPTVYTPPGVAPLAPPQYQLVVMPGALAAMTFGVRFHLDDYDLRAPSVTFRHPIDWTLLSLQEVPRGAHDIDGVFMNVVQENHPATGATFLCMRGTREYHEHPQHSGDEWLLYRGSINVFSIVEAVARCCCRNVAPAIFVGSSLLQLQWVR